MKAQLLDLEPQHRSIRDEILGALENLIDSNQFILGPAVRHLEDAIAAYCGVSYAVGVSSGTDALLVALMAIGVQAGDLVITPTFSFFATAGVVARLGATPVFVDIARDTFNISATTLNEAWDGLPRKDQRRVRAIIPVHLFGQCADMNAIMAFARERDIAVIEDAAQALGAEYPGDGHRKAGSMGRLGCFSFFPTKNLGGFGDGGMVVTDDAEIADRVRMLRVHGANPKYYHQYVGGNFRLDTIQAAVLLKKFPYLDDWHRARRTNAARYRTLFVEADLEACVSLPLAVYEGDGLEFPHIYNQFVIRAKNRDALRLHLSENGVTTAIYYPLPLHLQPCFEHLGYAEGNLPVSERAAQEVLALPVYPGMTAEQQAYVVEQIERFYR